MSPVALLVLVFVAVQALSPPGPVPKEQELENVVAMAQGSLNKTFSELQAAAEGVMAAARHILQKATTQANDTVLEAQSPLLALLESVTNTVSDVSAQAKKVGANVTTCTSGQVEASEGIVRNTGGSIVGCVTTEFKKAVTLATSMFSVASSARNLLNKATLELHDCIPSNIPTVQQIVNIPSCIGAEFDAYSAEAHKIVKVLASQLVESGRIAQEFAGELKKCSAARLETGTGEIRRVEQQIATCVQERLGGAVSV